MKVLYFIVVAAMIGALCFLADRSHRRQLERRIQHRPPRNDDEFSRLFPNEQGTIAVRIRQILQPWVDIDLARMAPTDWLCRDLGLARLDGMDVTGFIQDVEKAFHIKIPDSEAEKMRSLKDVTEFVASATKQDSGEPALSAYRRPGAASG